MGQSPTTAEFPPTVDDRPLVVTKVQLPRGRADVLPRPLLDECLTDAVRCPLTVVCAPAGFGKTTQVAQWARRNERRVAWLSLDEDDSTAATFWRYVGAALERVRPGIAEPVSGLLRGRDRLPREALLALLVNQLAVGTAPAILVLDDYHLLKGTEVHETLGLLLERLPSLLRLVVISRADPPLPLSRLRARGELAELRQRDLRFSSDEASHLLRAAGLDLPVEVVDALATRTEGWVAGLQLAGLSMRGHPDPASFVSEFSGSHRFVLDYLCDEVLDRQPPSLRQFLLESSVLERLSGPLADAVTGRDSGQATLEEVERANLFLLPLDDVRGWWRYHRLFAELLQARLAAEQPQRVPGLHRAAARWFDQHGFVDEALRHALGAGDPEAAGRVVERHLDQSVDRSDRLVLERRLSLLPRDVVNRRPPLLLAQALLELRSGHLRQVQRLAARVDALTSVNGWDGAPVLSDGGMVAEPSAATALLRAQVAAVQGRVEQTARQARCALGHLGEHELGPRLTAQRLVALADWMAGDVVQAERRFAEVVEAAREDDDLPNVPSRFSLGRVQRAMGRSGAALETFRAGLAIATQGPRPSLFHEAQSHAGIGQVLYDCDRLQDARAHTERALEACRLLAEPQLASYALVTAAWIDQAEGHHAAARATMDEACRLVTDTGAASTYFRAGAERARLLLAQGAVDEAARWAEERGLRADDEPSYLREPDQLVLARVLIARGATGKALELLDRLSSLAEGQRRIASVISLRVVRATALHAGDRRDAAVTEVLDAVTQAATAGHVRVFLDEGAPMVGLLRDAARRVRAGSGSSTVEAHLDQVLAAMARRGPDASTAGVSVLAASPLVDPLTPRELEVLTLLVTGAPNRAIAENLVVSLDTVKRHVTHILAKLGAANRTEAATRARDLRLLH